MKNNDTRYPYTYSADYIRRWSGVIQDSVCDIASAPKLSRSDASGLATYIALALGMDREAFCKKMADQYLAEINMEAGE